MAVLPGRDDALILDSKTTWEKLSIVAKDRQRAQAFGHDELVKSEDGQAAVPRAVSTKAVGSQRVK